jgi:hypothetical protein
MSDESERNKVKRLEPVVMSFINNWEELSAVEDSETYTLEIEEYSGWVRSKDTGKNEYYLSTHTFYGSMYESSSKKLQSYGFNVQLRNWDA